jgi:hypothetical protein
MESGLLGSPAGGYKAGTMQSVQTKELIRLDDLLVDLGKENESQCELLREHLESARVYLVGLMPVEYAFSLKMAAEALNCVSDHDLRARLEHFIHGSEGKQDGLPS